MPRHFTKTRALIIVAPLLAGITASAARADEAPPTIVVTAQRPSSGPGLSSSGAGQYSVSASDIATMPAASTAALSDVLATMPGVAIDQNQQIHIRDTEGPQFQYQINGALVPLDINTNPPFLTMIDPGFVEHLDLIDGVLPAHYAYATGGVVDISTKDGCAQPGGGVSLTLGQRGVVKPSAQWGGCAGPFSYYINAQYEQGNTAFSPATPGVEPIHDERHQGQGFGYFADQLSPHTRLSLTLSAANSNNQLPNQPDLPPAYTLAGGTPENSAAIDSRLNFRDRLAMLALTGGDGDALNWQIAYAHHAITQAFRPDNAGELIYQGVSSTATHTDHDDTLEGDIGWQMGTHHLSAGVYAGLYRVDVADTTLAFPADADGIQLATTPVSITSSIHQPNLVLGIYAGDLWQISPSLKLNTGLRYDRLAGFTDHAQLDPTLNLSLQMGVQTALHAGYARYMQVPSFQGVAPDAATLFAGTTAAASQPGAVNPLTERDDYLDVGLVTQPARHLSLSIDGYYAITDHYLDTGQFGVVPIFAPFNYGHGFMWGAELALRYTGPRLTAFVNLTLGQNRQQGVVTGQFNFDADELAYINAHAIQLDHQPLAGVSAGASYGVGGWRLSLSGLYSSGLRGGFADSQTLPMVLQFNAAAERSFRIPGLGRVTERLAVINLADRINLIRPAEGIGIFQSAYGPRLAVENTLSLRF